MEHRKLSEFSGVVGQIIRETFSWKTLFTGIVLGFIMVFNMVALMFLKAPNVAVFVIQILMAAAMARFALNGLSGEWNGTLFSTAGGSWGQVAVVTGRYLFVTFAWLVPVFFLGLKNMSDPQMMMMGPAMGGRMAMAFAAYMMLSTLSPPVVLIAAVSATDIGEFLSAAHWKRLFSGRGGDLFMVYAAYAGTIGMAFIITFPILMATSAIAWQLTVLVAAVIGAFLFGWMVNLLGRLCGFFAFGEHDFSNKRVAATPKPGMNEPRLEEPAPMPAGPAAVPLSDVGNTFGGAPTGGPQPLSDPQEKVQEAHNRFNSNPDDAIAFMRQVHEEYAPHPQILHALCLMCHKTGKKEEAVTWAKAALPVCFNRGALPLAAEILKALWKFRDVLDLTIDRKLKIAASFARDDDLIYAANTYALVLQEDRNDARAIKGIMHVAETLTGEGGQAADAAKLYSYLQKTCPDTPLMEYILEGLERARKLEAVSRAS